jgi:hypothetical protein
MWKIVAPLAFLAACSSTPGGFAAGEDAGTTTPGADGGGDPQGFGDAGADGSNNQCTEGIDVVLVLDVSSSMGFALDKLDAEIGKVVDAANKLAPGAHFGIIFFVDNDRVDDTGSNGKVHTTAATLQAAFKNAKSVYTNNNRNPGDGPGGRTTQNPICEENALDALHHATTEFPWRNNAARVAILVTDDTFLDKPDNYGDRDGDGLTNKTDYPREGDYPARFEYTETVTALRAQKIRVFSFTRLKPPGGFDLDRCGTGRRHSTDDAITYGWSQPWKGKAPIPEATDAKNFDLDLVKKGSLSLSDTIQQVVLGSHCNPPK